MYETFGGGRKHFQYRMKPSKNVQTVQKEKLLKPWDQIFDWFYPDHGSTLFYYAENTEFSSALTA
jgi:hypothetical protein